MTVVCALAMAAALHMCVRCGHRACARGVCTCLVCTAGVVFVCVWACGVGLQEFRAATEAEAASTGRPRLLFSIAAPAGTYTISQGYDIAAIAPTLDW